MNMREPGGTPGGMGTFLLGLIMVVVGGYLLLDHVTVYGGFWRWGGLGGSTSFGITLIPLLFGVGILFANGQSMVGRALTAGGTLVILVGIIANMDINFRQTSLFNTLVMLILIVGGVGLVVRSVLPQQSKLPRDPDAP